MCVGASIMMMMMMNTQTPNFLTFIKVNLSVPHSLPYSLTGTLHSSTTQLATLTMYSIYSVSLPLYTSIPPITVNHFVPPSQIQSLQPALSNILVHIYFFIGSFLWSSVNSPLVIIGGLLNPPGYAIEEDIKQVTHGLTFVVSGQCVRLITSYHELSVVTMQEGWRNNRVAHPSITVCVCVCIVRQGQTAKGIGRRWVRPNAGSLAPSFPRHSFVVLCCMMLLQLLAHTYMYTHHHTAAFSLKKLHSF